MLLCDLLRALRFRCSYFIDRGIQNFSILVVVCCLQRKKMMYGKNTRSSNTFSDFFLFSAFADAAVDPIDFPIAPAYAVPKVRIKLSGFWKKKKFP